MALLHDILDWTKTRPAWQRDAARRLLQKGGGLTDQDYKELYVLMKAENGIEKPTEFEALYAQPLATEHIPAEGGPAETVILKSLRDLENVNRIAPNQTINFSETGITVIYGDNASGKSGYARVLKYACRARDQSEEVYPNAYDVASANSIPAATFDVDVAGVTEEIAWSHGVTPPEKLSKIAVFDSKCARSYLLDEKDVAYLPYGLDIIENLANQVLPKMSKTLESEIHVLDTDTQPFQHLIHGEGAETEVGRQIAMLNAVSDVCKIRRLGVMSPDEIATLEQLEESLRASDPGKSAHDLRLSADRLKGFAATIAKSLSRVDDQAVQTLQQVRADKITAESNEQSAAVALQSGEKLLAGTGEQVWKLLFEAARRYSVDVAYPGKEFPNTADGAICPLCQDPLSQGAKKRLVRFEEYIQNEVAEMAKKKLEKFQSAKKNLENADVRFMGNTTMIEEIRSIDRILCQTLADFEKSLEKRKQSMLDFFANSSSIELSALPEDPYPKIRRLAAQQIKKARVFVRAANQQERQALNTKRNELSARKNLSQVLGSVVALIARMQEKAALEKCMPCLQTREISTKSKEFASYAVTGALQSALDKEFQSLGVGNIKTRLKERSERGRTFYQLLLNLPPKNKLASKTKLNEILSEGEQRSIAIGSFLAELSLGKHFCGVVFDDPVSSLDHNRRRNVAERLVDEAKIRQVIVFTHDTSFLGQLQDEIQRKSVSHSIMSLEWSGGSAGNVKHSLPWAHQGYKERIDYLEKSLRDLPSTWPAYPNDDEADQVRRLYDKLRATLERVVQDCVLNGVIQRYRDWIRVRDLKGVVGFSSSEFEAIYKLYRKCCDVTTAHDPASAKSDPVPTPSDLRDDINALKHVAEQVRQRKEGATTKK